MDNWLKAMLAATPTASSHETARGTTADARPAFVGKRYIAGTESTKAAAIALIWRSEAAPNVGIGLLFIEKSSNLLPPALGIKCFLVENNLSYPGSDQINLCFVCSLKG
jgi:hypothetical protein